MSGRSVGKIQVGVWDCALVVGDSPVEDSFSKDSIGKQGSLLDMVGRCKW